MLCQFCQKRVANVHFTQVINGNKTELYLCEQCARDKGQSSFGSPFSVNNFFSGIMEGGKDSDYRALEVDVQQCDKCGMTYREFQKIGKLGCDNCYSIFGERIKPLLKRLHGNIEHTGKVPGRVSRELSSIKEIEALKELLNKAILSEEYEKAAELRDKIKALEAKEG